MPRVLTAFLLFTASANAQAVIRVGPGRQFTDLQAAIDFAQPGDRILVDPGSYTRSSASPFYFSIAKGVRITGQAGTVLTSVFVTAVPAGETVTLSGVEIQGYPSIAGAANCVVAVSCAGAVVLDQCRLTSATCFTCTPLTWPRLFGNGAAAVVASRCSVSPSLAASCVQLLASTGMLTDCGLLSSQPGVDYNHVPSQPFPGGVGLDCRQGSLVQLVRTRLQGGQALPGGPTTPPGDGTPAAKCESSELQIVGSVTVIGGLGGNAFVGSPYPQGGAGGAGVSISQGGTLFHDAAVRLIGGPGGQGTPPGPAGPPLVGTPVTVANMPSLAATTMQLPGGSFQLEGLAAPGTLLYLFASFDTLPTDVPGVRGRLVPRLDALAFVEGPIVVGGSGRVTRVLMIPNDPGLSGVVLFAQALGIDPVAFPLAFFSAAVPMTVAF